LRFAIIGVVQRVARISLAIVEIIILSALILAARCANYQDVFVAEQKNFFLLGKPTAASVALNEISVSGDCAGLNGAERRLRRKLRW
jgi:hypothetical protein